MTNKNLPLAVIGLLFAASLLQPAFGQQEQTSSIPATETTPGTPLLPEATPPIDAEAAAGQPVITDATPLQSSTDFNGDGKADILWRYRGQNSSSGYVQGEDVIWLMNGTTVTTSALLPTVKDLNWFIAGSGDFNGDGKSDILWRNNNQVPGNAQQGQVLIWLMNGTTYISTVALPTVVDGSMHIRAVGDFNGDGKPDIVWRNYVTGANEVWLLNGTTYVSTAPLPERTDLNWNIYGSSNADFNGDGKTDLVWYNPKTGASEIWLMNGTTLSNTVSLPKASNSSWEIGAIGDYNGDGKADILWRNYATGLISAWLLNGTSFSSSAALPTAPDTKWNINGPR